MWTPWNSSPPAACKRDTSRSACKWRNDSIRKSRSSRFFRTLQNNLGCAQKHESTGYILVHQGSTDFREHGRHGRHEDRRGQDSSGFRHPAMFEDLAQHVRDDGEGELGIPSTVVASYLSIDLHFGEREAEKMAGDQDATEQIVVRADGASSTSSLRSHRADHEIWFQYERHQR